MRINKSDARHTRPSRVAPPPTRAGTVGPGGACTARPIPEGQAARPIPEGQAARPIPEGQAARPVPEGQAARPVPEGQAARPVPEGQAAGPIPEGDTAGRVPEGDTVRPGPESDRVERMAEQTTEQLTGEPPDPGEPGDHDREWIGAAEAADRLGIKPASL